MNELMSGESGLLLRTDVDDEAGVLDVDEVHHGDAREKLLLERIERAPLFPPTAAMSSLNK